MEEIVLGRTIVVSRTNPPARAHSGSPFKSELVSYEEAAARATFSVRRPSILPSDNFVLDRVGLIAGTTPDSADFARVFLRYRESELRWLVLHQSKIDATADGPVYFAVPSTIYPGRVGGSPAALCTFSVPASALPGGQLTIARCLWELDGCLMELEMPGVLTTEALLRTAASVR